MKNIDVKHFNTSKVNIMTLMFAACTRLTEIDVSNFDTSNVSKMTGMFQKNNFISLDLSNFNTGKVTDMSRLFYENKKMQTVYVSDKWTTKNVTAEGEDFFYSCTNLVGGAGTVFDSNHTDITYARVDEGPESEAPGYFTFKPIN